MYTNNIEKTQQIIEANELILPATKLEILLVKENVAKNKIDLRWYFDGIHLKSFSSFSMIQPTFGIAKINK